MSHKNNKNSKNNKKSNPKTKKELEKMKIETANEIGYSKESRKLGKNKPRPVHTDTNE
ncbi:small, acid-soluble spore protein, alpha/beta type [Clostridium sp. YIM B02505]|uniref:Small, acid-soluble spore protein, alpha/beta type n=1 Tax=Clostridium yunnanense TaxID=2800325 RepID=A0ABS1EJ20_9CLOT|nr:small, acid-soluble spore protein, alpha/beta type [Clostridium yunnanense]MBK1809363.1 small, acid-soluble spore protein, alpha/beta type [Clostridium yunnanense]